MSTARLVIGLWLAACLSAVDVRAQGAPPESAGGSSFSGGAVTTPITFPDGTEALPSVTNTGDENTGVFWPAADTVAISTGGTERFRLTTSILTLTLPLRAPTGSSAAPSISFTGDTNSGLYSPADNLMAVVAGGVIAMYVSPAVLVPNVSTEFPIGTVGAPSLTFAGDTNLGLYRVAADQLGVTANGGQVARFTATAFVSSNGIDIATTAAKPTCDSSARGRIWVTQGGAGVADAIEKCLKDGSDAYAWSAL